MLKIPELSGWEVYERPAELGQALEILARHRGDARIIAGGTDLLLEIERRIRTPRVLIDITRIPGLDGIRLQDGRIHIGALVTHNQAVASPLLVERAYPLARACWEVGAPQIRNRGTIAGNLVTASPANDTIAPLWAMDASVHLASARGERTVSFPEFFRGVRRTALDPDEMVSEISFPALDFHERGTFIKLGLRKSQAISVINVAAIVASEGPRVRSARIALGSVAPTIVRAREAESYLTGRSLDEDTISEAARRTMLAVRPIDDVRSPADYRLEMAGVLTARALRQLSAATERVGWPAQPAMLWGVPGPQLSHPAPHASRFTFHASRFTSHTACGDEPIEITVNGTQHTVHGANGKTLLQLLREDLGLTGTKEGCGEGECGACTVHLDGAAVMACLVPAPAAHGSHVVTVEGLAHGDALHPVQQAFIEEDAVQCGYCTPGFIMAAAKLLEEYPSPTREQIEQAISGNLCRCTGYVNIVRAIERSPEVSAGRSGGLGGLKGR